MQPVDAFSVQV
jgi:hypothetical protein